MSVTAWNHWISIGIGNMHALPAHCKQLGYVTMHIWYVTKELYKLQTEYAQSFKASNAIVVQVVISAGELPDGQATIWCNKNIPEKLNPVSRVHVRHRRQTDNRHTNMPCH